MLNALDAAKLNPEKINIGKKPIDSSTTDLVQTNDFERVLIAERLGVSKFSEIKKNAFELDRIIGWAKESGAKNLDDIVQSIKNMSKRVGAPGLGDSKIKQIYRLFYLDAERRRIGNEIKQIKKKVDNPTNQKPII